MTENNTKVIEFVDIVFENCESVTISAKDVYSIYISQINDIITYDTPNDGVMRHIADNIYIELMQSAYVPVCTYGYKMETRNIFERIKEYADIVYIELKYSDDTAEIFYAYWGNNRQDINEYQYTFDTNHNTLVICITKSKNAFINNRNYDKHVLIFKNAKGIQHIIGGKDEV